ncbi:MAG: hypothetical protein ABSD85_08495 [Acidimicrobiales bacterium]
MLRLLVVLGLAAVGVGTSACGGSSSVSTTTTSTAIPTTTSGSPNAKASATTLAPAPRSGGSRTATSDMKVALRHGGSLASLHYVSTSVGNGVTTTIIGDVNRTSGAQTVAVSYKGATVSMEIELVGNEAYFRGSAAAIADIIGLSVLQSSAASGQWVSVVPANSAYYQSTAAALTVSSVMSELALSAPITSARAVAVGGRPAVEISGAWIGQGITAKDHATAELEVTTGTASLPIRWSGEEPQSTKTARFTASFVVSKWGETVRVVPPAVSVPLSTILKSTTTTTQPVVV